LKDAISPQDTSFPPSTASIPASTLQVQQSMLFRKKWASQLDDNGISETDVDGLSQIA